MLVQISGAVEFVTNPLRDGRVHFRLRTSDGAFRSFALASAAETICAAKGQRVSVTVRGKIRAGDVPQVLHVEVRPTAVAA